VNFFWSVLGGCIKGGMEASSAKQNRERCNFPTRGLCKTFVCRGGLFTQRFSVSPLAMLGKRENFHRDYFAPQVAM